MEQTDKELLLACRRGDETAWQCLVLRYQRLIYAIPRRSGLDEDQATDIFQDVFLALVEKLDEIEQPERLHAWLVTTARRKTLRAIAKERANLISKSEEIDEHEMNDVSDTSPLPDEALERLEQEHRVRAAVDSLDERCRKLLKLLFYRSDPPPYAQVAAELGTREGSIGPTRARCLEKLMRILQK
jgi:RNA polymerase sigma factor (sigma-70 family)